MKTVFTSRQHIAAPSVNQSFGNHLLHLFFIYNLAKKRNFNLGVSSHSNLDNLFDLSEFKKLPPKDTVCLFSEEHGGDIKNFTNKELSNYDNLNKILNDDNYIFPDNFYLEGWFWHKQFIPPNDIFVDLKLKNNLINDLIKKYPIITQDDTLVIHYRGTDFKRHSIGWGDLTLPFDYYLNALEKIKTMINIKNILLVSDEGEHIFNELKRMKYNIILSNENYINDWLLLFLSKNLICSNSSFCWTASIFNKKLRVQPKGFFLYNYNKNEVFPPNSLFDNSIII